MTEPMASTSVTAPGSFGKRVGNEGTYAHVDSPSHTDAGPDQPQPTTTADQPHSSPTIAGQPEPTTTAAITGTTNVTHGDHRVHDDHDRALSVVLLVILCFVLPPLAVGLEEGVNSIFFLNIILLILGWLPAIIHALFVVCAAEQVRGAEQVRQ